MSRIVLAASLLLALAAPAFAQPAWQAKVDPELLATAAWEPVEALVVLAEQADLAAARRLPTKEERGRTVFERLSQTAARTQKPLLELLRSLGLAHRPFWIANFVWVRADLAGLEAVARRAEVAAIEANPRWEAPAPPLDDAPAPPTSPEAIEWNILKVRAEQVWALGFTGQGVTIAGQDTGYDWDHPALKAKYRGWNGTTANHNYHWHDAIHSGGGACGPDSPEPCDDGSHGTHTMGTMVGDDGGSNQIGMAPGAKWIGCRNMDVGDGTPATYSECFQWFVAPTDLAGANPDPTKAPHVINNSWGCPASEGCTTPDILRTVVENSRAAGIVVVVSAGNSGSACGTVNTPAAIYEAAMSVGSTTSSDSASSFSSRGPVTVDGSGRLKPDIAAPGSSVRSSVPGTGYSTFSGTSMAGPHVAGLVALLLSAQPRLAGHVGAIERLIRESAVPRTSTQNCGGFPGANVPNAVFGWGRIDALAAVERAQQWLFSDGFEAGDTLEWGL